MQDKLYKIIKDNLGSYFLRPTTALYNIFPKHIPDGAIDQNFYCALVYNLISNQINFNVSLYSVQLTVFHKDYTECRRLAVEVKKLFNNKTYTDEIGANKGFLNSQVNDMVEIEFDTDTGMYGTAVNVSIKTALDW